MPSPDRSIRTCGTWDEVRRPRVASGMMKGARCGGGGIGGFACGRGNIDPTQRPTAEQVMASEHVKKWAVPASGRQTKTRMKDLQDRKVQPTAEFTQIRTHWCLL